MDKTLKKKGLSFVIVGLLAVFFFGSADFVNAEIIETPILNNTGFLFGNIATTTDDVTYSNLSEMTLYDGTDYYYFGININFPNPNLYQFDNVIIPLCSPSGVVNKDDVRLLVIPSSPSAPLSSYTNYNYLTANKDIQECGVNNVYTYVTFSGNEITANSQILLVNSNYSSISQLRKYDIPNLNWRMGRNGIYPYINPFNYSDYYNSTYFLFGYEGICDTNLTNRHLAGCTAQFSLDYLISDLTFDYQGSQTTSTATSTATSTLPIYPTIDYLECGITSGELILGCIKNAFLWSITAPQSDYDKFNELLDTLKKKPPIGYVMSTINVFSFSTSTNTFILVSEENILHNLIFVPLRQILVIIIFIFGAVWLFRRVKDIII